MGKWIVCAAWPYVNTVPHLGTFIHLLSADVFSRYLRSKGETFVSVTGSDEHGTPIEVEAIKAGIPPSQLTDKYHEAICYQLKRYGIEFSNYTRTESPVHIKFVQDFYKKVYDNGYVGSRTVNLLYCPNCERYLPDRFVEGTCPHCGSRSARGDQCDGCGRVLDPTELRDPRCMFCDGIPTVRSSTHWFFDLPKFQSQLRDYLDRSTQFPENARSFSCRWLEEGLKPRALTRDNKWGIPAPFPGSEGKTIYVWLEAVLGYVSATVEWALRLGKPDLWKEFWFDQNTKNVHFIGKDNIPFHTIILPALLMATEQGYVLPWQVGSTEFILYEGEKFSKSHRIGVWVDEALNIAEPDYWRYVLMAIRPEAKDANFTWKDFESRVNTELNDIIGNFIHRTLTFVNKYFGGRVPSLKRVDRTDETLIRRIEESPRLIGDLIEGLRLKDALAAILELARSGNQYLSDRSPWHTVKADPEAASTTLHISTQLVRSLAILLEPFIPFSARKIWDELNLSEPKTPMWNEAGEMKLNAGHNLGRVEPIFHKVDTRKARIVHKGAEPVVTLEEFSKNKIKVGTIVEAKFISGTAKLIQLRIDLGGGQIRQSVSAISPQYAIDELFGKQVVVLTNVAPTKVHGALSEVMILAAVDNDRISMLVPDRRVQNGTSII